LDTREQEAMLFRSARVRSEMKQNHAADIAGVEPPTMSKYERGELPIPSQVIVKLHSTRMGRTKPFYTLLCTRCEIRKTGECDGTKCPVGRAINRRPKNYVA
jgi:DNA-binding XRE family transcriptional regulator